MRSDETGQGGKDFPYDDSLLINSRLKDVERQQREDKEADRRHNRSQLITNRSIAGFTFLLFVTSAVSDFVLIRQTLIAQQSANAATIAANAAKTSADLTKRAMEANSAAICNLIVNTRDRIPRMYYVVTCDQGKVSGTLVRGDLTVSIRSGKKTIPQRTYTLIPQLMRPLDNMPHGSFELGGFSETDFYALRQSFVVSGSIEYNDGFDRIISSKFCRELLPFRDANGKYGGMVQPDCGTPADDLIRQYKEADKH
jgi:hypothetical protein